MAAKHDTCDIFCFDEAKVNRLKPEVSDPAIRQVAKLFKVLADATRAKIAYALCQENELCVCDVANIVGSSVASASHHLRLLRSMGVAKFRKEGKLAFYSLEDDHVRQFIRLALTHAKEAAGIGKTAERH